MNDFPVDLISGISLILVYTDLFEYQNTGDVKAPVLRIIDSGKRVESGKVVTTQNLETRSFFRFTIQETVGSKYSNNKHSTQNRDWDPGTLLW